MKSETIEELKTEIANIDKMANLGPLSNEAKRSRLILRALAELGENMRQEKNKG